ncbi:MFS transporter [Horticoccus sp. 23ND18S-11]|uniref:MFS transporter n=1 Tax=Horticoccus sp. 23ND18S-11 TaxID=3391832 RepID=UPI0039C978FE
MSADSSADPSGSARLPCRTKFTWALGSLGDNYAGNTIGQLKDPVYTVALGVPPEMIGWALSVPLVLDAFFDPVVGFWSDNWRGRWGRRRPFILAGAILLGVTMTLLWLPPAGSGWSHAALAAYFLGATMLFYAAYSFFLVPYRALGLELTTDYHERTRLQGWGMMVGLIGGLGLPWLYKIALLLGGAGVGSTASADAILAGARWVGAGVGILILVTCLVPALGCREPAFQPSPSKLRLGPALAATLRNRPFLHMLGMNFFATVGMYSPVTVSLLVSIYFLFQGNQDGAATLTGYLGMAQMIGSLAGVPINTGVSVRLGKRGAALIALGIGAAGFASLWWTLLPAHPYAALASQFLIGWGMQGVWLMSATMNADVCDSDELATGQRREGVYGAVFALEQKIAFAVAALLGGYLVSRCGYVTSAAPAGEVQAALRTTLVLTPLVGLTLAAAAIATYPLTRRRVLEIQAQLPGRRAGARSP